MATYMPIRRGPGRGPLAIRMDCLSNRQAQKNHSQSLDRLKERHGISPKEALALYRRVPWQEVDCTEEEALLELLDKRA